MWKYISESKSEPTITLDSHVSYINKCEANNHKLNKELEDLYAKNLQIISDYRLDRVKHNLEFHHNHHESSND